jgi:hypothetical protein
VKLKRPEEMYVFLQTNKKQEIGKPHSKAIQDK